MKNKLLICVVAAVMLLCTACGHSPGAAEESTAQETEHKREYLDDLPETDAYAGVEFRVLAGNPAAENNFLMTDPGADATVLQSASYGCAELLAERFGITMKYTFMDSYAAGHQAFLAEITQTTLGGPETSYDLVVPGFWYGLTIAKGNYIDLNTLSNLNFSREYWNQAFNENVEINDCLYACVGDFGLDSMTGAYAVAFNQSILRNKDMTSPFAHYDSNTWTLETLLSMSKDAYNDDIEGAGTYGILLSRQPVDAFYTASGLKFYEVSDGEYKLTKYSEKAEDLYQTLYKLVKGNAECKFTSVTDKAELVDLFMQDRALFGCFTLDEIKEFRNMQTDYGVIVYPKYDSAQENYISGTSGGGIFAIPKAARDPEMSALVLEAMSAAFHQNVIPALIEITLEGQSVRDERSSQMISQIIENIYWDFGFINNNSLGNVANFGIEMENGYSTMSSWYRSAERTYRTKLAEYLNTFLTDA